LQTAASFCRLAFLFLGGRFELWAAISSFDLPRLFVVCHVDLQTAASIFTLHSLCSGCCIDARTSISTRFRLALPFLLRAAVSSWALPFLFVGCYLHLRAAVSICSLPFLFARCRAAPDARVLTQPR